MSETVDTIVRETPLAALHEELGAKMIPFAGWRMPVQYSSIMKEHSAVRNDCGVFDISHMGQIFVEGEGACCWLNNMLANDVSVLDVDQGQYSFLLNENGGVIDDLILYRCSINRYLLVVNASKIDEDLEWLQKHSVDGVELANESDFWAGMAIQGPKSADIFSALFGDEELPPRNGYTAMACEGELLMVCRTGYTGEDGFEFFSSAETGSQWFQRFVGLGAEPCGLGARDSLRLEVCYPLNGADLSADKTPLQAGMGFFCKLDTEFIGRDALLKQKEEGLGERLVAIKYTGKGAPPRAHYKVCDKSGVEIAELTSGVLSPTLMEGIGMAYLPVELAKIGTELDIDVRGRKFPAEIVKKPFYKKA